MVLQSKLSVSFFDVIKRSVIWEAENLVVVLNFFGTLRIECLDELFFFLVYEVMLLEKSIEGGLGLIQGITLFQDLVVVGSTLSVIEHFKCLINQMEFCLGLFLVFLISLGKPLVCKFFIGLFNFECGCVVRNPKDLIIVFDRISHFFGFNYTVIRYGMFAMVDSLINRILLMREMFFWLIWLKTNWFVLNNNNSK